MTTSNMAHTLPQVKENKAEVYHKRNGRLGREVSKGTRSKR
ncbi:MAG: hypothetical protein WBQ25_20780 [Nitrososphaeraceae archaeon]